MGANDSLERDEMGRVIDPVTGIVLAGPGDRVAEVVEVAAEPAAGDAPVVEVVQERKGTSARRR